jgi:L-fuculose-phosphate aldolase
VRTAPSAESELRAAVVEASRRVVTDGLTRGTSGNVSARLEGDAFVVTPSGAAVDALTPDDLVRVSMDGAPAPGARVPSSEWRIHRDIYRARPDVGGIVHAHPPFATTIACLRRPLPAVHYEIAFAGGHDVRCATYATFGTEELSRAALEALEGRNACLLANHGVVAVGDTVQAALRVASVVETVAELYYRTLSVGGGVILDEAEMTRVLSKFTTYGKA